MHELQLLTTSLVKSLLVETHLTRGRVSRSRNLRVQAGSLDWAGLGRTGLGWTLDWAGEAMPRVVGKETQGAGRKIIEIQVFFVKQNRLLHALGSPEVAVTTIATAMPITIAIC